MKKVSIIIPCYNVEKWIDRCVHTLVEQTIGIDSLELVFVDDASTDRTMQHLQKWEKRFPESVLVVACEENGRQGTARNIGLSYASAPYIGYVDADDWVEKDMYETLYQAAIKEDVEVVTAFLGRDTGDGRLLDVKPYAGIVGQKILIQTEEDRHAFLKSGFPGSVCTKIFKKEFLIESGLFFPEKLAYEDNYFGAVLSYVISSAYVVDKVMYHYFYNLDSTVTSRNSPHQLDRLIIEAMVLERLEREGFLEPYRDEIAGRFLRIYYINTLHLIFTRFDALPFELLEEMRETVLEQFPDWKHTESYEKLSGIEKGFLQTLEVEMTEEMWNNLKNNYLDLVRKKD